LREKISVIQKFFDEKLHFITMFNPQTGSYVRSGILNEHGGDSGIDPFQASFPHLIDVGVMGHCIHGKTGLCVRAGVGCYQSGLTVTQPNMTIENFRWIASQCKGRVNQFALGGRGDPDQHEHFEAILSACRENELVPNFTTSGYGKGDMGFSAANWIGNAFQLHGGEGVVDVEIWFSKERSQFIRERLWHPSQSIEEREDGSLILKMQTAGMAEVKNWALQFGRQAEVLSPMSLRNACKEEITKMMDRYHFDPDPSHKEEQ